jgi:hypothetical protein
LPLEGLHFHVGRVASTGNLDGLGFFAFANNGLGDGDVFQSGQVGKEVELLKDQANPLAYLS